MKMRGLRLVVAVTGLLTVSGLVPAFGQANTNAWLYSGEAVQFLCLQAQQITANTAADAVVIMHRAPVSGSANWSFLFSSAAPYEGPNLSAYNGKQTPGDNLDLTVQAYPYYSTVPATGWRYAETVSCKMKDAEGINFHFGAGSAGPQQQCRAVNEMVVADVYANLTSWQAATLVYQQTDFVFEDDSFAPSGPVWVNPLASPFAPRTIYVNGDGMLHVKTTASFVARTNPTTAAGPDKKGSYYCHVPTPEHVLAVIRGQVAPCSFDSDFCIR